MPSTLTRRPQATAFSIEDLLDRVRRGEVRIPDFQRPLKWTAKDVRDLFDSVYRGYPIGTLLFWKREAPAASVHFGPVRIDAPSHSQALWVVDGQQRITALAGVLLQAPHAEDGTPSGFALFFDLETEELVPAQPPSGGMAPPAHWLPLSVVLDSEHLLEWLDRYAGRAQHPEHTRLAIRLGKSIREYQVPAYVVEAAEEKTLRIIFKRLNTAGAPLTQAEVFNALHGGTAGTHPLSLRALAQSLGTLGFGTLREPLLLRSILAVRGLDFTRDFRTQLREEDDLTETLQQTERALRDAVVFLKRDAGIPHIALLPQSGTLYLLARFFHLHPEPGPRSRELLSRWVWRRAVASAHEPARTEKLPELLERLRASEEQAVQALLAPIQRPATDLTDLAPLSEELDLAEVHGRLEANALLSLRPRHLRTGALLDLESLLDQEGPNAFQPIITAFPDEDPHTSFVMTDLREGLPNYLFHPRLPGLNLLDALRAEPPPEPEVLHSHGISPAALAYLREGNTYEFLSQRLHILEGLMLGFLKTRARWDESDRPSLQSLIIEDEED